MKPLEIAILLTASAAILALPFVDRLPMGTVAGLAVVAAALTAVQLLAQPFRWQMAPAWAAVAALVVASAFGLHADGALRLVWTGGGLCLCALSAALAAGLPLHPLPAPDGPLTVATTSVELVRPAPGGARRLTVKLWYPADPPAAGGLYETLWNELQGAGSPALLRVLTRYLKGVRTHALAGAPMRAGTGCCPLVLYHHGLISIPSETTLLMESLASHGYVVASVSHADQMAEYRALSAGVPAQERAQDRAIAAGLRAPGLDRARRAGLTAAMIRNSSATPAIVRNRADDSVFVLDRIEALLAHVPGCENGLCVDANRIGALGLSLGGAVATRLRRRDARCIAAANLDGGLFADPLTEPLPAPYLMLYSAENVGANDTVAQAGAVEEAVAADSRHMDFHDATLVWPLLKWIGVLGRVPGAQMVRWRNEHVRAFFDARLKAQV